MECYEIQDLLEENRMMCFFFFFFEQVVEKLSVTNQLALRVRYFGELVFYRSSFQI